MSKKEEIIEYCSSIGIDLIGFTECRVFEELRELYVRRKSLGLENEFEENNIEKRINPFFYMDDGKTIISIGFPYMYNQSYNSPIYFSKYTRGIDYHIVAKKYLEKICNFIKSLGGKAECFVDSNALPERYIAYLCGIGFIGKNNMIINEKYGSYIFLGEIITDLYIEKSTPIESKCGDCNLCIKSCPTNALDSEKKNPNICLSYITQKKNIGEEWMNKLGGRLFGCDTCQDVCPFNKDVNLSTIHEFKPLEFMEKVDCDEILNLTKKDFNEKYKLTSCGWRGKNIIQRNMLINLANLKKLDKNRKFNSPYVEEYYNKLLKKHEF